MRCSLGHLDSLKKHCESIVRLCTEQNCCQIDDNDHLGFMSLCFLSKQIDHMNAVLKLFPHQDMQLISRAMIEGLCYLKWCFKEPDCAFQWKGFAFIIDWRRLRDLEAKGKETPHDYKKAIEDFISEYSESFKTKKNKNKPIQEGIDPYHKNWKCGKKLKEISKEVQGDKLYEILYSKYSDWQHWGVEGISRMINKQEDGVYYVEDSDPGVLCSALAVAFQCLYEVMELNNNHHKLGLDDKLVKIYKEYMQTHAGNGEPSPTPNT